MSLFCITQHQEREKKQEQFETGFSLKRIVSLPTSFMENCGERALRFERLDSNQEMDANEMFQKAADKTPHLRACNLSDVHTYSFSCLKNSNEICPENLTSRGFKKIICNLDLRLRENCVTSPFNIFVCKTFSMRHAFGWTQKGWMSRLECIGIV
jgi:hypothetical protein